MLALAPPSPPAAWPACPCGLRAGAIRQGAGEVLARLAELGVDTEATWAAANRLSAHSDLALDTAVELLASVQGGGQGHGRRVVELAVSLAEAAGLSSEEVRAVRWGAALHDLGKVRVPREVLDKPGPLTGEERTLVQGHAAWGAELLTPLPLPAAAVAAVRHHHERWDGGGYPRGLRCRRIPLAARIVAIADVFDALISARPYKPAWCECEAARVILRGAGSQFDPRLARLFVREVLGFRDLRP
ncbi:putative nucleotidyltransferase with HDIG domain [Deinococcus sp. HSC-46F16]|uniref:HD-GYP domain-containing protein n=1 Tax=Deinococcus sp. HSC-46F16 TaxID=2910968 RepID=UPI0020A15992|nr:HD domain-containing phosphohydrolase [Deinococcus sp. HSC-46F16]MCP2013577.1 putative nucleotidyltransferase with HDIG domain [Deinococcus sp. HSC-46F16]